MCDELVSYYVLTWNLKTDFFSAIHTLYASNIVLPDYTHLQYA